MASTHKSLRSGTANKRPTTSIADGQIALNTNTTSPGLFFKDSTGATIIKVGPVHVGTTAPNASPAAGGSAGNSVGEIWLDTSLTPVGVKIWNGSAFVNATPIGSTTVQGLLELATSAETQTGTDTDRAVTPAGLQSKVSDSTSTTSSTTIASSTAVKSAYDLANAALPKSGGTVTGNLEIGTTGSLSFEGATADAFETTIAVTDPTADRTITLPDTTGTVVTTGDTGTVTSTMIADGTIVDGDISASAEIAVSKLADGTARQLLQTDAAGTGVEWASNIDVPGTLDVTSTATFDSIASHPLGSAAAPTLTFTGDTNTGIYSPGADQVAISTNGTGRLFVDASGNVGVGAAPVVPLDIQQAQATQRLYSTTGTNTSHIQFRNTGGIAYVGLDSSTGGSFGAAYGLSLTHTGAYPITFVTNGTERMRLDSSGRLGVGTSSPATILDLNKNGAVDFTSRATLESSSHIVLRNNNATSAIVWPGTTTNSHKYILWDHFGGTQAFRVGCVDSSNVKTEVFSVDQQGITVFRRPAGESARIDSSGRLGLGTSSPSYKLDVATISYAVNQSGGVRFGSSDENSTRILQKVTAGGIPYSEIAANKDGNGWLAFTSGASDTERLRITGSGNVGIGTTSPNASLVVAASGAAGFEVTPGSATASSGTLIEHYNRSTAAYVQVRTIASVHRFDIGGTEAGRFDSSGRFLVGTSSTAGNTDAQTALIQTIGNSGGSFQGGRINLGRAEYSANITAGEQLGGIYFSDAQSGTYGVIECVADGTGGTNDFPGRLTFSTTADGASSPTERMRITNSGEIRMGNTNGINIASASDTGVIVEASGTQIIYRAGNIPLYVGRQTDDGSLVQFRQAGVEEGSISVSGTTVSYNGAHLSRWAQLPNGAAREEILRGTVLSNIDEMCDWGEEDNEQLNRMKVSDVEGDKNVSGVFQAWDDDDDTYTDDFYCAMTGDFIIRIAEGTPVHRGQLLMSAGDGTAKPQGDGFVQDKTIAKVTSNHVTCTYEDGSYCVPCVLMAC